MNPSRPPGSSVAFPAFSIALLAPLIDAHKNRPGALLPLLHAVQDAFGHVPAECVAPIAAALNLSRAEVHGVITFYHDFRDKPRARHTVQICRAESCQAMGAERLIAHAEQTLGCRMHQHDADARFALEPVYCLGQCASSPAIMIDGKVHTRVSPGGFDALLAAAGQDDASPTRPANNTARNTAASLAGSPTMAPGPNGAIRIFVPCDSSALAQGANAVATAIAQEAAQRSIAVQIVRNGSRGMSWLEPLVEVETAQGRVAYGPVGADDVASLFDARFDAGGVHALGHGLTAEIPYLKNQARLTFARCGITDPLSIADYEAHEGFAGLKRALQMDGGAIVKTVTDSGLRGRGGAAFPAGVKWKTVRDTSAAQKYIVCNADEGDSGTFSDRMIMEGDPFVLIEGMTIAALAVGAHYGYIYVRSEYPHSIATLNAAIAIARAAGYLGDSILGSGNPFDIEVRKGAGAYICGEETALLESLEGKRGIVRAKPPLPALSGLFGKPTVINNVITLASVPIVMARGAEFYRDYGMGRSRGTLPFQLAGNIQRGGLIEKAFGITLRELLYDFGGGSASGRPIKAVQVGGPLGAYLPESQWDTPLDYEAYAGLWAMIGHGGIVVHDDTADMAELARYAMEFCAIESCGKCTPCRIGSTRGAETIDKIRAQDQTGKANRPQQVKLLRDLCDTMLHGSLCAMGGMTPYPVLSALNHFPEDFGLATSAHGSSQGGDQDHKRQAA